MGQAPPDRVLDNKVPGPGAGDVPLPVQGAPSVNTAEGQAQVLFESTSVSPAPGQSTVSVTLVPADPAAVGPPPTGQAFYSNAYRITAVYEPSGAPVPGLAVTVALAYSSPRGDRILRWSGSSWEGLQTTAVPQSLLAYAPATALGTLVVAGRAGGSSAPRALPVKLVLAVAAPFALILAILAAVLVRRRRTAP